ncbi:MAG: hypothetical protein WBD99_11580 [Thermodesulfobacteriota bacterium]
MPKRSRKQNEDINLIAKRLVADATQGSNNKEPSKEKPEKNPAAVALGRLGGLKGGKARAKKLSAKKRKAIAKKAATARWGKK